MPAFPAKQGRYYARVFPNGKKKFGSSTEVRASSEKISEGHRAFAAIENGAALRERDGFVLTQRLRRNAKTRKDYEHFR